MKMKWYDGIALAVIYIAFVGVLILTAFIGRAIIFPEKAEAFDTINQSTSTSASDFSWGTGQTLVIASTTLQYYEGLGKKIYFILLQTGNGADLSKPATFVQNGVDLYTQSDVSWRNTLGDANPRHPLPVPEYDTAYDLIIRNDSTTLTNGLKQYFNSAVTLSMPELVVHSYSGTIGNLVVGAYIWTQDIPTSTPPVAGDTIINITDNGMTTSEWTCETTGDETICTATATTSVRQYDGPTYYEWLLVAGIMIFILFYMLWPRLSILKFRKE